MIDKTGASGAQPVPEKAINVKGNNEQWQRHLEKAYFERQRDAMRTADDGALPNPTAGTEPEETWLNSQAEPGIPESVVADARQSQVLQVSNDSAYREATPGIPAKSGVLRPPVAGSDPLGAVGNRHTVQKTDVPNNHRRTQAVQKAMPAWRGVLPETSSVSILRSDNGAHLVIRDESLGARETLRLLGRLRVLFAEQGEPLAAITLNGEAVWQLSDRSEGDVDEYHIDRRS